MHVCELFVLVVLPCFIFIASCAYSTWECDVIGGLIIPVHSLKLS